MHALYSKFVKFVIILSLMTLSLPSYSGVTSLVDEAGEGVMITWKLLRNNGDEVLDITEGLAKFGLTKYLSSPENVDPIAAIEPPEGYQVSIKEYTKEEFSAKYNKDFSGLNIRQVTVDGLASGKKCGDFPFTEQNRIEIMAVMDRFKTYKYKNKYNTAIQMTNEIMLVIPTVTMLVLYNEDVVVITSLAVCSGPRFNASNASFRVFLPPQNNAAGDVLEVML